MARLVTLLLTDILTQSRICPCLRIIVKLIVENNNVEIQIQVAGDKGQYQCQGAYHCLTWVDHGISLQYLWPGFSPCGQMDQISPATSRRASLSTFHQLTRLLIFKFLHFYYYSRYSTYSNHNAFHK